MDLTIAEAAQLLGKSDRQIRYLIKTGKLKAGKRGSQWLIDRSDLPLSEGQAIAAERAWLLRERGLRVHLERAYPRPCHGRHKYLGFVVSHVGVRPGPRLERRLRERVSQLLKGDPERLRRSLASYRGAYLL